jgi:hypothetical protein
MKSTLPRSIIVLAARTGCWMAVLLLAGCGEDTGGGSSASVSPDAGSGTNGIFTVTFADPKGAAHIKSARVLINGVVDGREACYVFYDRSQNAFLLINDKGDGSNKLTAGTAGPENSQCRLDQAESLGPAGSNSLSIRLNLTFKPSFKGRKQVFLAVDDADGHSPDLQPHGTWIVPSR